MKNYWTGIILIIAGVLFLSDSLGFMQVGEIFRKYWPVALILVGVGILLREPRHP